MEALQDHLPLEEQGEAVWLTPESQAAESWIAHREIDTVLPATSLVPAAYVDIG